MQVLTAQVDFLFQSHRLAGGLVQTGPEQDGQVLDNFFSKIRVHRNETGNDVHRVTPIRIDIVKEEGIIVRYRNTVARYHGITVLYRNTVDTVLKYRRYRTCRDLYSTVQYCSTVLYSQYYTVP